MEIKKTFKNKNIIIPQKILNFLFENRQKYERDKERGGLLFYKVQDDENLIITKSLYSKVINSNRNNVIWDETYDNKIIEKEYSRGNHFIGTWHTHFEDNPEPSYLDKQSMMECFKKSKHTIPFFLLIIVGKLINIEKLYVAGIDSNGLKECENVNKQ